MVEKYMVEWGWDDGRETDRAVFDEEEAARALYGGRETDPRALWRTERMTAGRAFDSRRVAFRELSPVGLGADGEVERWGDAIDREEYGIEDFRAEEG